MKKILFMAFLAFSMNAFAQESDAVDLANEEAVKYNYEDEDDHWSSHLFVGVITPTDLPKDLPKGLEFSTFRSWEFAMTITQYDYSPNDKKTTLSAGLGFGVRFYTLDGHDDMFYKDDKVVLGSRTASMSEVSSRILTINFGVPLLVKQRFAKNFAISLGAQPNWNPYARISNSYEIGDQEFDVRTKKIGQRTFTVDILGIVHFAKDLGVYFKYSPMSVLKEDRGPEFKSFTVGIYL